MTNWQGPVKENSTAALFISSWRELQITYVEIEEGTPSSKNSTSNTQSGIFQIKMESQPQTSFGLQLQNTFVNNFCQSFMSFIVYGSFSMGWKRPFVYIATTRQPIFPLKFQFCIPIPLFVRKKMGKEGRACLFFFLLTITKWWYFL